MLKELLRKVLSFFNIRKQHTSVDQLIPWPEEKWAEVNGVQARIAKLQETLRELSPNHRLLKCGDKKLFNERYLGGRSWDNCECEEVIKALKDYEGILSAAVGIERLHIARRFRRV